MSKDLLDQLADLEIPARPDGLERQVHQRLNSRLLLGHLLDLAISAAPYALLHFGQALAASISFSLSGRYPKSPKRRRADGDGP